MSKSKHICFTSIARHVHGQLDVADFKDTFLECPVCVEHFNQTGRRPRLLNSCLHAFCTSCLQTLLSKEGGSKITCPLCRHVQTVKGNANTLPIDPVRDKLTEYLQIKLEKKTLCTDCPDGNEAEFRCQECLSYICTACHSAHRRHRLTKNHKVITLDELLRDPQAHFQRGHFCESHPTHQIEFYCNTDEHLCCVSCCIVDHKDHDIKKLENAAEAKRGQIERNLQVISKTSVSTKQALQKGAKQRRTILYITKQSEDDINTIYNSLKDALEHHRKRHIANLQEERQQALTRVQTRTKAQEQTIAMIETTQGYFTKWKESADAVEVIQMYPTIMRNLEGIKEVPDQDIEYKKLRFKADVPALKKCLSVFADHAISGGMYRHAN